MDSTPVIDIVILTALKLERDAVVRALGGCVEYPWRGRKLHHATVSGLKVLVVPLDGMGGANSAYVTKDVIGEWNPTRVFLVGIAGGALDGADDLRLGDVLVAEQVVGYELAKMTAPGAARRYQAYRADNEVLDIARDLPAAQWTSSISVVRPDDPRTVPVAHFGTVLSGDKVVADEAYFDELRAAWPKAIGIEMEGLGVGLACYRSGCGFFMAKAVSDFAGSSKDNVWQPYAADTAARFAVATIRALADTVQNSAVREKARLLTVTLEPISTGHDLYLREANLNGKHYGDSIVHRCTNFCRDARSDIQFDLGGRFRKFECVVGVLDEAVEAEQRGYFRVFLDNDAKPVIEATHGAPVRIEYDVSGVLRLRLVAYRSNAIANSMESGLRAAVGKSTRLAALAWGNPTLFE